MQFKIARILNTALIIITLIILAMGAGYIFIYNSFPEYKTPYLIGFAAAAILLLWLFKWLESRWDKRIITKMASSGKIALVNIESAERILNMRDSTFSSYWLYSITGRMLTPELEVVPEIKFYEKMNAETGEIPRGTLFITYDKEKPSQIFIVPNVLISHLPELMPTVQKMEGSGLLDVKYLNAYYHKGMVVKTIRETLADQRHAVENRRLMAEKEKAEKEKKEKEKERKKK